MARREPTLLDAEHPREVRRRDHPVGRADQRDGPDPPPPRAGGETADTRGAWSAAGVDAVGNQGNRRPRRHGVARRSRRARLGSHPGRACRWSPLCGSPLLRDPPCYSPPPWCEVGPPATLPTLDTMASYNRVGPVLPFPPQPHLSPCTSTGSWSP